MKYYLEPQIGKDGKQAIVIRGRDKRGKQFRIFLTGQFKFARIELSKWNQEAQRAKGNAVLNETLKQVFAKLVNSVTEKQVLNPHYDIPDAWKDLYCPDKKAAEAILPQNIIEFIPFWKSEAISRNLSNSYIRIVDQLKADLARWNKDASFDKLTTVALKDFKLYLEGKHDQCKRESLAGSAVYSRFKYLKVISKYAKERDISVDPGIFSFKAQFDEHQKGGFPLDYEELMKLWFYKPINSAAAIVKDIFLMECFSGIRVGDLLRLRCGDIMSDHIEYRDQKNKKRKRVTLHKFNLEIVGRHRTNQPDALLFPQISQQEINVVLKSIARGAGVSRQIRRIDKFYPIDEILATHCGRKSYATLLSKIGVPGDYVIQELGHAQGSITYETYVGRDDIHNLVRAKVNALEIAVPKTEIVDRLRKAI